MRNALLICLAVLVFVATPLWADEDQPSQPRQPGSSEYGYEGMGPGMMGPGSGYEGRGPGMMSRDQDRDRGMGGYGQGMRGGYGRGMMGPDEQGWRDMNPEKREQWRKMRSQFMQDTLPMRQELSSKQMELETLWDQPNPDPEKVKALSARINELRSKLQQKHDEYLTSCRRQFGDRGWACPGGIRLGY